MEMTNLKLTDFIQIVVLGLGIFVLLEIARGTFMFPILILTLSVISVIVIKRML